MSITSDFNRLFKQVYAAKLLPPKHRAGNATARGSASYGASLDVTEPWCVIDAISAEVWGWVL